MTPTRHAPCVPFAPMRPVWTRLTGAALVVRQLAAWGAPPALLAALRPPGAARAGAGAARHPHHHSYSQEDRAGGGADCDGGGGSGDVMDAAWGNPASCRSRPLLLALGWLVAAARLFERRIAELEPGTEARALLPPYPPVGARTCVRGRGWCLQACTAATQCTATHVRLPWLTCLFP